MRHSIHPFWVSKQEICTLILIPKNVIFYSSKSDFKRHSVNICLILLSTGYEDIQWPLRYQCVISRQGDKTALNGRKGILRNALNILFPKILNLLGQPSWQLLFKDSHELKESLLWRHRTGHLLIRICQGISIITLSTSCCLFPLLGKITFAWAFKWCW